MRAIRRIGKTEQKFVFSVHVCDVRGLPAGVSTVSVSWQRGDRVVNTPSVSAQGSGGERGARIDAKLTHVATLYASKDQFDPKPSSLRVLHTPAAGAKPLVIAVAELDLAEYVTSHAEGTARPRQIVKQVLLTPPRGSEHKEQVLVQLSVDSHASMLIDQTRPLAVAELGSCASSARAWRLWDRSMLSGERPAHWAPSHCLGCSSWPPPKSPFPPPLVKQADAECRHRRQQHGRRRVLGGGRLRGVAGVGGAHARGALGLRRCA